MAGSQLTRAIGCPAARPPDAYFARPAPRQRWIVGAGNHGCWVGSYEWDKRRAFERAVRPGAIVFDIGAHAGFYTLLASVLVGSQGSVFAFEPVPHNLRYLTAHVKLNNCTNVTIVPAAVSAVTGEAHFDPGPNASQGRLDPNGTLIVQTIALDDWMVDRKVPVPDVIKMDIEGGELDALRGSEKLLRQAEPVLFLATHGPDIHRGCCDFLTACGYALAPLDPRVSLSETDEIIARKQ